MNRQVTSLRNTFRFALIGGWMLAIQGATPAQSLWEVSPYRIHVWLNLENHPEIPSSWITDLPTELEQLADVTVGAPWELKVAKVTRQQDNILLSETPPNAFDFLENEAPLREIEKLIVLDVQVTNGHYLLTSRELDINTRIWSNSAKRSVFNSAKVPDAALELMCDIFVPLAQIVQVEDMTATAQVRAGALHAPEGSSRAWQNPAVIQQGDVLLPFIRKKDRSGKVKKEGVNPVLYTVMLVDKRNGGTIDLQTFSGYTQPFNTRRSSRVQQLALVARSWGESTTLKTFDRKNKDKPLIGIDVYARRPNEDKSTFIGRTDWRGMVTVPKSDTTVRMLFLKSGAKVMAKLPVVPGLQQEVGVGLRNDEARLEAEGFLLGIQESLVDLVARREILSVRIRYRIENEKFDEAQKLLEELGRLPTREDFETQVTRRRQLLSVNDELIQGKIDKLFSDTRELFAKFLDPRRIQELRDELAQARASGS